MKKGLVLEGGAMRGMFTCGVMDVLLENNIEFDGAIGVSAGAAFGCNYKSKQIGRAYNYNREYCNDKRYWSIGSLLKTGDLYNVDFCYETIPFKLSPWDHETFIKNPMEFYVVCTDINTGKPFYYKMDQGGRYDTVWLRASASMPIVSRIVKIGGYELLDGGISDSIPIRYFESIGYDRNVVVLTQPYEYVKKKNKLLPIIKTKYKKYPNLIKAVENRHIGYNETTDYIKSKKDIFVIQPKEPLNISSAVRDPKELERVYKLGRETALEKLESLKEYLNVPK